MELRFSANTAIKPLHVKEIDATFQLCLLKSANFQPSGNFKTRDKLSIHYYVESVFPLVYVHTCIHT